MNNEFRADLHIHSNCSDGIDSPIKILDLAKEAKLSGLSITDHDTIQAYTEEFSDKAKELGLNLLLGTEVSSEFEGLTVHVLAYNFRLSFQTFLTQVQERRKERNWKILEKLKKKKIIIEEEDLHSSGPSQIIGRLHIAKAMVKKNVVISIQEAFEKYLKDDASCYAPGGKFTPNEVIDAIHQENGFAILAHPHFLKRGRFVEKILQLPLDGLECYYGRLFKEQELPWVGVAKRRNWIVTGGSDYHGDQNIPIGASWIDEATFKVLSRT